MPALAWTDAVQPAVPEVTMVAPLTVGGDGNGTTVIDADPGKDAPAPGVVTTQFKVRGPLGPAENVIELVLLPDVIVEPAEMLQA